MDDMTTIYRKIQTGEIVESKTRQSLLAWSIRFAMKHGRLPKWADVERAMK